MAGFIPLMDDDAQRLYINSMLGNHGLFARVNGLLDPKYFDPDLAKGVAFIKKYFEENRTIPATSIFTAATKIPTEAVQLNRGDSDYIAEQIAEFCRFKACIQVIQDATGQGGYFEKGDLATMVAKMKQATEMGLLVDLGIDYFDDPLARLNNEELSEVISTGWTTVDAIIGGGVGRQELINFWAPSGGGKSVGMLNLGHNFPEQGLHGVYFSLEMRDSKVATRADQLISRIAANTVALNKAQVAESVSRFHERTGAKFFIKRLREGSTANDMMAYLRQLEIATGVTPDFFIADYIDIMHPNGGSSNSMFEKDKEVSEELRGLAHDFNSVAISASQLEKGATDKINEGQKMHQGNLQGGSSKTNTSDLIIAVARSDAMMAAGECRFDFPKSRNSDANTKQIMMKWNKSTLKISDFDTSELEFQKKEAGPGSALKRRSPTLQMDEVRPGAKKATLDDLTSKFDS